MLRCRTCGKAIYCLMANNIFKETENIILNNIKTVSGLLLQDESELPAHICGPCEVSLREAIMFRERIIRTQKLFLDIGNVAEAFKQIDLEDIERLTFPLDDDQTILPEKIDKKNPPKKSDMKLPKLNCRLGFPSTKFTAPINFENLASKKKSKNNWKNMTEEEKLKLKRALRRRQCICEQCGKSFTCPSNFKVHLLQHTGVKDFKCKQCPMMFYTLQLLSRHESTHLSEKPHACQYCKKTYSTSSIRNYHERRHHINPKSFKCSDCGKVFPEMLELKKHMIVHSDVRNFRCNICDLLFKTQKNLTAHYRSKTHKNNAENSPNVRVWEPIEIQSVVIIAANSSNKSVPNES